MENIWIVIPSYNEQRYIGQVLTSLKKYRQRIIVIDDGSTDRTHEEVTSRQIICLKHLVNLGKGASLKTGCEYAFRYKKASAVILMDADGQHLTSDLPGFIKALDQAGFIIGQRNLYHRAPLIRLLGSKLTTYFFRSLYHSDILDPLCGFRAMNSDVYSQIRWESNGYEVEVEMLVRALKNKISITSIPIKTVYLDKYKGVTILTAYKILLYMLKWRLIL